MSSSNCCFLTCIQISLEAGLVFWSLEEFSTVCCDLHSQGFDVINKADVFLKFSWFFYDLVNAGNLISGSSAFSKSSLNIWNFSVHILLKPSLEDFEHELVRMCNCMVVRTFFGIALLWDWNENWPFPVLWPLLSFPNLLTYWVQHLTASPFSIWNSSTGIPSLH